MLVEGEVPARLRATGQTVLGAVLSYLWGGVALEHLGAKGPYLIAGPCSIGLGIFVWYFLRAQMKM